ncbi:dolichyl-P-Man:Man(5)GlcNAc(2)-PP-dolichol alpha-1,3-mannosyltransferase [Cryptotrichosporon argae]
MTDPLEAARLLAFDRRYFWLFAGLLGLAELVLGLLIIWRVPYTKIDWVAYMQQVDGFLSGERDYSRLEGETGALVYPAFHLWIYTALYSALSIPREKAAQYIFLAVYLATFFLVAGITYLAGRPSAANTRPISVPVPSSRFFHLPADAYPQILLLPLALSKRAHSIYLLRLFNDPFAMFFLYAAIVLFMLDRSWAWNTGSVVFSLALGIKMNILLFVPGLLVVLFQFRGLVGTIESAFLVALVQVVLPYPFLATRELAASYLHSAFDFSRQFLYEWSVNWAFVPESTFLSKAFARGLLAAHVLALLAFGWYRWSPVPGGTTAVLRRGLADPTTWQLPAASLPVAHIPLVLFSSNLIGMAAARSLHFQFHAWYFHQLPLLLHAGAGWGDLTVSAAHFAILERSWATAPATKRSAATLLLVHLSMIASLWVAGRPRQAEPATLDQAEEQRDKTD